jgi:hypothetical protein
VTQLELSLEALSEAYALVAHALENYKIKRDDIRLNLIQTLRNGEKSVEALVAVLRETELS